MKREDVETEKELWDGRNETGCIRGTTEVTRLCNRSVPEGTRWVAQGAERGGSV